MKSELFDDEIAAAMSKAGCIEVCTGVESGSDRILKNWVRKNTTYAINKTSLLVMISSVMIEFMLGRSTPRDQGRNSSSTVSHFSPKARAAS